ncbi:hypothetical protein BN1723_007625 [Verticillium longisporum]|uniref:COP9 signalosome complex subunit 2 n=1 Tax=Verticillium longisporum TaxID=100787 RepID=A0A0G4NM67_VERLO|nr:hypothetical protein BN1723_007625 [Verticillium longisporum]
MCAFLVVASRSWALADRTLHSQAAEHYAELLTYVKNAVTRNYSEKSINNLLDFVEKGSDSPESGKCVEQFYSLTLQSFQSTNNERLWLKTNIKLAKLLLDRKDYQALAKKVRELHKACHREDGSDDPSKGTYSLEIYVLEIQMYAEMKNNKQLKRLYVRALQVKSAVPHPKIMGIIRECGGKMHMSEENWIEAQSDFHESFRNYDEAGSLQRIQVLKYLLLTTMLTKSTINPFDSQETKPYKTDPRITAMTDLVDAYQRDDVHAYQKVLEKNRDLLDDPFIAENIDEVTRNMRTKGIVKLIAPYTRMKLAWIVSFAVAVTPTIVLPVMSLVASAVTTIPIPPPVVAPIAALVVTVSILALTPARRPRSPLSPTVNIFFRVIPPAFWRVSAAAPAPVVPVVRTVPAVPYDFEYEEDDDEETGDVDIENKYYNAKQQKAAEPEEAIAEFLGIPALEDEKGEWGFKGLKQAIKLEFRLGKYNDDLADVVTDSATAMALLMTRFNDAQCSNAIVYHLRLLAGSWLKGNSNDFEPFLVGSGGLLQWCNENIEVPDREIDHIGITLLANILLKPIGFVLEITYLDRTPGPQANGPLIGDRLTSNVITAEYAKADPIYVEKTIGPLIGDRLTSNAITAEYAKADPVYVEKTINLPQTYSHYRPVQGDGNCGWRAIGFSYFEHLVFTGDPDKLSQELARLTSLNNYIANVGGYDFELFEDMVHETLSLIKDLADVVTDSATAMALLMTRFNDAQCSNAIVYHLRLLAGSWLKGNANDFEPFLVGSGGLLQWCNENIEVPDREIDHIGITLLANILLKPIGFVLEITYLDRTPGSQANVYRLPEEATGQDPANLGPIIYLLYRPAHYDILYHKMSSRFPNPAAGAPAPLELQVNRAMSFSQQHEVASATPSLHNFSTVDFSALAMLPGFSGPPSAMSSLASPTAVSPMHNAYDPSPQTPWLSAPFSDSAMQQTAPPAPSAALGLLRTQPRQPPPSSTTGSQAAPSKPSQPVDYQLRFSSQCFHLKNSPAEPTSMLSQNGYTEPNFTTTMFKNSHFNKAHYNNPQFHPEEWVPDDEPHDRSVNSKRKIRSRSD